MTPNRQGESSARRGAPGSIAQGVARLACFRARGLEQFPATPQAFLSSLAPLIAFPLVGATLMLLGGGGEAALVDLLATLVAVLTPPVLSERLAALWRRDAAWLRYAVAFNWCQWAIPFAAVAVLFALGVLMAAGLPERTAAAAAMLGLVSYALGLHWFLAHWGLGLSRLQAAVFVVAVNVGTGVVVMGPRLLASLSVWEPTR